MPCAECGVRYDPAVNAFCPRCGSTARGTPEPAVLAVARRRDPARRRVQASGVLLVAVGLLFLVSTVLSLTLPVGEMAKTFVGPMASQPGGTLVLVPDGDGPYNVTIRNVDGEVLANATGHVGEYRFIATQHAALRYEAVAGNETTNGTALVFTGDTLRVPLDGEAHELPQASPTLQQTIRVARYAFLGLAALLLAGGACAIALRAWPLAAVAAVVGILLAALVLLGYLLAGLLFALPFGFAAYFILRGKRYFEAKPKA